MFFVDTPVSHDLVQQEYVQMAPLHSQHEPCGENTNLVYVYLVYMYSIIT